MKDNQLDEKLLLLDQLQSVCTHCGLCSEGCPTFQASGWEHESPRGRLKLAERFLNGKIPLESDALSTFDRCLGCRACEPLCPQKVEYHHVRQIVQEIRRELPLSYLVSIKKNDYRQWIKLAYRLSVTRWRHYGARWLTISGLPIRSCGSFSKKYGRVIAGLPVLAISCIQDLFQHDGIEQSIAFVKRLGGEIQVDRNQPCCGALFERLVEGGEEAIAYPEEQKKVAQMQREARENFTQWIEPETYFLSRGCQCFISDGKETSNDFYAWIESLLDQKKLALYLTEPLTVYYQPYCRSKRHSEDSIWRLLNRIQGLTIREVIHSQICCGGYCGETLFHRENAEQIAKQKIDSLPAQAHLVVTSPDCWGLFKQFSGSKDFIVCYPIQILMKAELIHK